MSKLYIEVDGKKYVDANWIERRRAEQDEAPLSQGRMVQLLERIAQDMGVSDFSPHLSGSSEKLIEGAALTSIELAANLLRCEPPEKIK